MKDASKPGNTGDAAETRNLIRTTQSAAPLEENMTGVRKRRANVSRRGAPGTKKRATQWPWMAAAAAAGGPALTAEQIEIFWNYLDQRVYYEQGVSMCTALGVNWEPSALTPGVNINNRKGVTTVVVPDFPLFSGVPDEDSKKRVERLKHLFKCINRLRDCCIDSSAPLARVEGHSATSLAEGAPLDSETLHSAHGKSPKDSESDANGARPESPHLMRIDLVRRRPGEYPCSFNSFSIAKYIIFRLKNIATFGSDAASVVENVSRIEVFFDECEKSWTERALAELKARKQLFQPCQKLHLLAYIQKSCRKYRKLFARVEAVFDHVARVGAQGEGGGGAAAPANQPDAAAPYTVSKLLGDMRAAGELPRPVPEVVVGVLPSGVGADLDDELLSPSEDEFALPPIEDDDFEAGRGGDGAGWGVSNNFRGGGGGG